IIPTKYSSTQDHRATAGIVQDDEQPPLEINVSDGGAVQMRTLDVLEPAEASEWDGLVHRHPNATVFHTAAWARVVRDTYGHLPLYLYFHSAGHPVALIPLIEVLSPLTGRRAVCVPFSDACGPLLFDDNPEPIRVELARLAR